jgi:glutamate/tyrosine decarboxylase-like PLP-dependent enzyme
MYCVRPVPCNTLFGSQQKIDVAALERLIEEDTAGNRIPLIVLADAGKINIMVAGTTSWVLLTFSAEIDEIIPYMIAYMRG